jgi:hypothetical protein
MDKAVYPFHVEDRVRKSVERLERDYNGHIHSAMLWANKAHRVTSPRLAQLCRERALDYMSWAARSLELQGQYRAILES